MPSVSSANALSTSCPDWNLVPCWRPGFPLPALQISSPSDSSGTCSTDFLFSHIFNLLSLMGSSPKNENFKSINLSLFSCLPQSLQSFPSLHQPLPLLFLLFKLLRTCHPNDIVLDAVNYSTTISLLLNRKDTLNAHLTDLLTALVMTDPSFLLEILLPRSQ